MKIAINLLWKTSLILLGVGIGMWATVLWPKPELIIEKECFSGFVTIPGPYEQRLVLGDMEICGRDLEVGSIIGPSKLYDHGDPL